MKRTIPSLYSTVLTIITIFIAAPIFIESFGGSLLYDKKYHSSSQKNSFKEESKLIYLGSSILGQIGYSLRSSLNGGFLIFPVFDCRAITAKINHESIKRDENGLINTLFSLFIAAFLTAVFSFALSFFGIGHYLTMLPVTITIVIMLYSGATLFLLGCSHYFTDNILNTSIFTTISIIITISLLIVLKKKKTPSYIFLYVFIIIIIMNTIKYLGGSDFLIKNKLFSSEKHTALSIQELRNKINYKSFNPGFIRYIWLDVLSLSIFPLTTFAVNIPAYTSTLGITASATRELQACGLSNLFSSFSFYPTYFNCSGSILFHACGSNTPLHSLLAGVAMIGLYFSLHFIVKF